MLKQIRRLPLFRFGLPKTAALPPSLSTCFCPPSLWFRTEGRNFCSQPPRFFLLRCCCRAGRNGGLCDSTVGGLWVVGRCFLPSHAVHAAESCTRPNFAQEPYDRLIDDRRYMESRKQIRENIITNFLHFPSPRDKKPIKYYRSSDWLFVVGTVRPPKKWVTAPGYKRWGVSWRATQS